jgi:hypothetical protein
MLAALLLMTQDFRPPAVPLITHTPYFSIWSMDDHLNDEWARHWTGAINAMCGMVRIDGRPFRFMGWGPREAPAMEQRSVRVFPTRTVYEFASAGVLMEVEFLSPVIAEDVALASRPVTYLTFTTKSIDGNDHDVSVYFDITAEACVNTPDQRVIGKHPAPHYPGVGMLLTHEQRLLAKSGDNLRIDWGTLLLESPTGKVNIGSAHSLRNAFQSNGGATTETQSYPRPAMDEWPCLSTVIPLGANRGATTRLLLAYDEQFSAEYMGKRLRTGWRMYLPSWTDLLYAARNEYAAIRKRCAEYDKALMARCEKRGGREYAQLGALAYRQCMAAHCIVKGPDGKPFMFSKENFSNGCMGTVDVIYPASPFFLALAPDLLEANLEPVMQYAASPRWKFPFAPHDLGTYPLANGQVYGGGERTEDDQMPVEESGNMLIMAAALCKAQKSSEFASRHWATLTKWANYLKEKGLDPENQLCTDDFAGHLAHNANLSIKAIVALGGYAMLCDMKGDKAAATAWRDTAKNMAGEWLGKAKDGDHYRLAFDKPGTWSQKYNLAWDEILGLNLFPDELRRTEIAYYLTKQNEFGLPLDNRKDYTKLDWILWTACLADKREDFDKFMSPVYRWMHTTPDRVPLTDWFDTKTGKCVGFRARSVVGGVFLPLLGKM